MADSRHQNGADTAAVPPTVFFDGRCRLCDRTVAFILARDSQRRFHFAPLESDYARERLTPHGIDPDLQESVVLLEDDRAWTKSSAALRIAGQLPLPWSLARFFVIVPRFLRDAVYDWIARHRYRWFGQRESCRLPTPEEADRFHE